MHIPTFSPKKMTLLCLLVTVLPALAQNRRPTTPATIPATGSMPPAAPSFSSFSKSGPKPYKEIVTDKAITTKGLFTIHKVEEKWYFEMADSLLGRDILIVNRISKAAAGMRNYMLGFAGDQIGSNVVSFEKGPNNKIFLKKISFDELSKDSTQPMYRAVMNSNIQPIAVAFDIAAFNKDSTGIIIDMTSFINNDNDILNFASNAKSSFQVGGQQTDKSYVVSVKPYPMNVEIKTVKTYSKSGGFSPSSGGLPFASTGGGQSLTMELNSSIVLLPATPMQKRFYDPRVGFLSRSYTDFDVNPQGVKDITIVIKWNLEPKDADIEKYKRGELVEPKKPIVFYIDPATPKKWVPYLMQGVNDWQVAFEKAGFKNAIIARKAPSFEEDSTWSLEDARFSAIVYKPSEVANASGPHISDPRSGEILESHINWYHNVMNLVRNWYLIQCAAVDPRARKVQFDDELMGQLIRFISSHEVGHTLGLRHNFGASSTVPVEKLRDKAWVEVNGHTPSIMDYARFNYVAQPEDSISPAGLYPRIGDYDKWAIEWGYRKIYDAAGPEDEAPILNKITTARLQGNKRLFFGTETDPDDPRSQNEDLGDNAMKAGNYGIKNLQRIIPNLVNWTKVANENYDELTELYNETVNQFNRYLGHAAKNIGGIYETPKTTDQTGPVYEYVPKAIQQEAMAFLNKNVFTPPMWLINREIFSKTGNDPISVIGSRMEGVLNSLLSNGRMSKLITAEATMGNNTYTLSDLMSDLQKNIWTELSTHKPIDVYNRNLQKAFIERFGSIISPSTGGSSFGGIVITFGPSLDPKKTDIVTLAKATLRGVKASINAAMPLMTDKMSRYHLQDVQERIERILNPR